LQFAKKEIGLRRFTSELIAGFLWNSPFKAFSALKHKKPIPQNVVSTHPANILHIENLFCNPI
jgi:hypothetical protein